MYRCPRYATIYFAYVRLRVLWGVIRVKGYLYCKVPRIATQDDRRYFVAFVYLYGYTLRLHSNVVGLLGKVVHVRLPSCVYQLLFRFNGRVRNFYRGVRVFFA